MRSRLIRKAEDLKALGPAWSRLDDNAVSPMQQFIWTQTAAAAFAREGELCVVVVEEGDDILAVASLIHHKANASLEMLGVSELGEPTDALYSNPDALQMLGHALLNLGVPLHLRRVPAESLLSDSLKKSWWGKSVIFTSRDNNWPTITLDSSWAEPESHLNAGRRSDLRRSYRIAGEMGPLSAEVLTPTPATLAPLLDQALAVEIASWKGEAKTAMALDPLRGPFYRQYAAAACEKGLLRLCFLRIGERAAAMQMAIETGGRLWLLKIGYDKQFAHCSPGILLLRETLRDSAVRGLSSLEFLGTVENWIRAWTWKEHPCVAVRGYPFGLRGMNKLASDAVTSIWNKLGRKSGISK